MPSPVICRRSPSFVGAGDFGDSEYSVQVMRGARAMEGVGPEVEELRQRTGQSNNPLLCMDFFLGRVRLFPHNQPVLLLVRSKERLEGVVCLFEKMVGGIPTGYLRGFDHLTGESSVIAQEQVRASLLQIAIQQLRWTTRPQNLVGLSPDESCSIHRMVEFFLHPVHDCSVSNIQLASTCRCWRRLSAACG